MFWSGEQTAKTMNLTNKERNTREQSFLINNVRFIKRIGTDGFKMTATFVYFFTSKFMLTENRK